MSKKDGNLPRSCYAVHPSDSGRVIMVKRFEDGYYNPSWLTGVPMDAPLVARLVDELNGQLKVTAAQREAMLAGSMFGWDCPASHVERYNEDGTPKDL